MSGAVEDENDDATRSEEAKKRGTSSFMKKTTEGYKEALAAYTEAVELVCPPARRARVPPAQTRYPKVY